MIGIFLLFMMAPLAVFSCRSKTWIGNTHPKCTAIEDLALVMGSSPRAPDKEGWGSQNGRRKEEGEEQRETGKIVKPPCLCSKAVCRETPCLQITCMHVHTHMSPELQRRTRCGGPRAGSAQPGFHSSSGPAGSHVATAFPPEGCLPLFNP